MMKSLLCAAAVIAAPMVASAATVGPGVGTFTGTLNGTPLAFTFEPTEALTFNLAVLATGPAASLSAITYGFSADITQSVALDSVTPIAPGFALGVAAPEAFTSATPFTVYFFGNGGATNSSITLTYATAGAFVPAPVPLPAAGGMLALALAGVGGVAAVRRRKA